MTAACSSKSCLCVLLALVITTLTTRAAAQSPLTGSVTLGARSVDVSGDVTKFREDINLDDGVRVFDVSMNYRPTEPDAAIDSVTFNASNLGGDPFENVHLSVRKFGAFDLRLDRRRSSYFYEDTILPVALASVPGSTGGDFHHFDFERVRDTAELDINLSPATRISFGLEQQTRKGNSTTTLDIQRDEFELDRPINESLNAFRFGVEHGWQRVTLIFEEELRDFENTSELFLPGASPGQSATNPAELQFFMLDQSYDYDSRSHTLRAVAEATERLDVTASWRREDLELDMQGSEQSLGTDFTGVPFATDDSGPARVGRDIEISGVDLSYAIGSRARLTGGTRMSSLDQRGQVMFGLDQGAGDWFVETEGFEVGAEFAVRPRLLLAGGWSTESRETRSIQSLNGIGETGRKDTDRDGYFLRLLFTTAGDFELTAAIEDNDIDDPFSLASATESRRYKFTARQAWDNGLALSGGYRMTDVENDFSEWAADTVQTNLRLSYRRTNLELSGGYSKVEADRHIQALVTGGTRQILFPIAYSADSSFYDVVARWQPGERVTLGRSLRRYDSGGSFALERDDHRVFVEYSMTDNYMLQVVYRDVDFAEDSFDAYDAELLELAVRLNW